MFHEEMKCEVGEIRYNFQKHSGFVSMPEASTTDMRGTIEFFKRIDPQVVHIFTFQNGNIDTQYVIHDGEWIAI